MYFDSPETQVQVLDTFNRVAARLEISGAELIAWHEQMTRLLEQMAAACRKVIKEWIRWCDENILRPMGEYFREWSQWVIEVMEHLAELAADKPEASPFPTERPSRKPHILPIHIPDPVRAGRSPIWSRR